MRDRKPTLSPRDLARVVGVSESSLKRWADEGLLQISRTTGGHRRIDLAEAASYIRRSGLALRDASPLGLSNLTTLHNGVPPGRQDYLLVEALRRGDRAAACGWAVKLYLGGRSVCEICDGPIKYALSQDSGTPIGASETAACLAALDQLVELLPTPRPQTTALILTNGSSSLPARMMRAVLAVERWQCVEAQLAAWSGGTQKQDIQLVAASASVWDEFSPGQFDALPVACVSLGVTAQPQARLRTIGSLSEFASMVRCMEMAGAGVQD